MTMLPIPAIRNTGAWQQRWHWVALVGFGIALLLHTAALVRLYYGILIFPEPTPAQAAANKQKNERDKKLSFVILDDPKPDEPAPKDALATARKNRQARANIPAPDDKPALPSTTGKELMVPTFMGMSPVRPQPTPLPRPPTAATKPSRPIARADKPSPKPPARIPEKGLGKAPEKTEETAAKPQPAKQPSKAQPAVPFRKLPTAPAKPYGTRPTSPQKGGASMSGSPTFALLKARWPAYMEIISKKIDEALHRQMSLSHRSYHMGTVSLEFGIQKDGSVSHIRHLAAPTGMLAERSVCKRTLEEAGPFPPLTDAMQKDANFGAITVNFIFQ